MRDRIVGSPFSGPVGATLLFGTFSFLALREFITLSPTRRSDHRSLILAFFVVLPVQYVLRPNLNFRGFAGTIASGILRRGDEVVALPSGKKSKVKSIVTYDGELDEAAPPSSVIVTLEDDIDVSRGDMICRPHNQPHASQDIDAMVSWMSEGPPPPPGSQ